MTLIMTVIMIMTLIMTLIMTHGPRPLGLMGPIIVLIYELADLVFKGTLVEGVHSGLEYWLEVLSVPRGPKTESAGRPLL